MVESQAQTGLELLQPLVTIEPKRESLLDIVTFSSDIKILQRINYPVGSYCLLERAGQTAVFNVDSFFKKEDGSPNIIFLHSPFQDPKRTDLIFSKLFLERTRNGNSQRIDFSSFPEIVFTLPNYAIRERPQKNPNEITQAA